MPGCYLPHKLLLILCLATVVLTAETVCQTTEKVGGTLVVAVPVQQGLVVCSDKRLYNETTNTYRDDFVKIHKVNEKALFVATHTTGFLNASTGKMEFDIFGLTQSFVSKHGFTPGLAYWNSLRSEIRKKLSAYFARQTYANLPETDVANNRLLFSLVFFSVDGRSAKDYSLSVFYEKAKTPVIDVGSIITETVATPKLLGKGKDVMALLSRDSSLSRDPSMLRFDQSVFSAERTSTRDAAEFSIRLFSLTNARLPDAEVSSVHDCALLSNQQGFSWLDDSGGPIEAPNAISH